MLHSKSFACRDEATAEVHLNWHRWFLGEVEEPPDVLKYSSGQQVPSVSELVVLEEVEEEAGTKSSLFVVDRVDVSPYRGHRRGEASVRIRGEYSFKAVIHDQIQVV